MHTYLWDTLYKYYNPFLEYLAERKLKTKPNSTGFQCQLVHLITSSLLQSAAALRIGEVATGSVAAATAAPALSSMLSTPARSSINSRSCKKAMEDEA